MSSTKPTIKVRTKDVIAIHWFNAFFWLTLVLTGFGIISGDFVRLAPAFWPTFLQNLLGGNANLVLLHGIGGMVWAGGDWRVRAVEFQAGGIAVSEKCAGINA